VEENVDIYVSIFVLLRFIFVDVWNCSCVIRDQIIPQAVSWFAGSFTDTTLFVLWYRWRWRTWCYEKEHNLDTFCFILEP